MVENEIEERRRTVAVVEEKSEGKKEKGKLAFITFLVKKSKCQVSLIHWPFAHDSPLLGGPHLMAATWQGFVGPTRADLSPHFTCKCFGLSFLSYSDLYGRIFQN